MRFLNGLFLTHRIEVKSFVQVNPPPGKNDQYCIPNKRTIKNTLDVTEDYVSQARHKRKPEHDKYLLVQKNIKLFGFTLNGGELLITLIIIFKPTGKLFSYSSGFPRAKKEIISLKFSWFALCIGMIELGT